MLERYANLLWADQGSRADPASAVATPRIAVRVPAISHGRDTCCWVVSSPICSPSRRVHGLECRRGGRGASEGRPTAERSMPRWWRGPDPDPVEVGRLYVQENRTETEIAALLSVSRARVTAVLRDAGIPRRDSRKDCPVDPDILRALDRTGATATAEAREHGVAVSADGPT
jgi:hypothetical protein